VRELWTPGWVAVSRTDEPGGDGIAAKSRGAAVQEARGTGRYPGMDLPGAEAVRTAGHGHPRRRLMVVASLAGAVLALVGVNAWAFAGHDTARGASPRAAQHLVGSTTPVSHAATTTEPASTTTVIVTTTAAPTTTYLPRYVPPATVATTLPVTIPPTTAAPTTSTVAPGASLRVTPSTASFPLTPPPYWPMPIVPVTVTNTGAVAISSVVVHPVGVYSVPSNTCSTTLLPGQSCSAQVQFCPSSPGHYLNTLLVTGQDVPTASPLQASITLDGTAS